MKSIRVNYKLPPWMDEQLRERAKKKKMSNTEYVIEALTSQFKVEDHYMLIEKGVIDTDPGIVIGFDGEVLTVVKGNK